jgi:hypothetical protein
MVHPHVVLVTSPFGHGAEKKLSAGSALIRSMTSSYNARRASRCWSWMTHVSRKCIQKELPIQRRRFSMKSGVFSASSRRTQAQTQSEWAEYRYSSSLVMVGCTALAVALKRTAILVPVM